MTNNIFLATTALTDFWNIKSNKILFLGSWCTLYNRKQDWCNLNYEILDSPWKSKDDVIKGMKYCSKTYDILVERLAKYLNDINSVNYETRYWKIIIGPWFATFLHLYYNHTMNKNHHSDEELQRSLYINTRLLKKDIY
ncbi:hypothetical protein ES703_92360 [subsurface metagenome]